LIAIAFPHRALPDVAAQGFRNTGGALFLQGVTDASVIMDSDDVISVSQPRR
jgi:hypothetical protein